MTPEELADSVNRAADNVLLDETKEFFRTAPPRDIQRFIHRLGISVKEKHFESAKIALSVKIAEEQAESAAKLENYTRTLIRLTRALVWLFTAKSMAVVFGRASY